MGRHPSGGAGTGQAKMGSQAGGGGEPWRLPGQAGFQPHQGRCHRVKRGLGWRGEGVGVRDEDETEGSGEDLCSTKNSSG